MFIYRFMMLITLVAMMAESGGAQSPRPMSVVDLINVPVLSAPQLSPDGEQVLYVLAETDWDANKRMSHIWRVSADGSSTKQMTRGDSGETSPRWSPDGSAIAFLAERGDDTHTQIYLMRNGDGEARRLGDHPTAVSNIAWAPDGAALYYLASDPRTEDEKSREAANDDVYRFEEDFEQRHLWRYTLDANTTTRVTEGDFSVTAFALSPDGAHVTFHRAPNPVLEYADTSEIWLLDLVGSNSVQLTKNGIRETGAQLSPDGTTILFLARTNDRFEKYYNGNLFMVDANGRAPQVVSATLGHDVLQATWSSDGSSVFFVANLGVHSEVFQLTVANGAVQQLTDGRHAVRNWLYEPTGNRHVLTLGEPHNPGDVWIMTDAAAAPRRVTHVYDYLGEQFSLPRQERVEWTAADGTTVEGLIYYPLDYVAGQRYPLVVQTHGGPQTSDRFGFAGNPTSYVPALAGHGYLVFKPNYRGSTGYGDDFLRDMIGGYFQNAHTDVMSGVDHLIALGLADGDRLAKMGWSGGGHMTNKIVTYTSRFKAAASGAGAANWISMYAQSDTRSQRTPWFGGTPWQVDAPTDLYWEHSPLRSVANVTTPTIFLVGEDDRRVPMPQSVEMHRALKSLDVPTHLYVAPREGHGWRELRHQLFKMNAELDWFARFVTTREYAWEQPPGDASESTNGSDS
jgi:dipeptidyl aminopeptidase/acylaminoacyl peptidase